MTTHRQHQVSNRLAAIRAAAIEARRAALKADDLGAVLAFVHRAQRCDDIARKVQA